MHAVEHLGDLQLLAEGCMFRTLVAVPVGLTLLMPPGMCICLLVPLFVSADASPVQKAQCRPVTCLNCDCCSRRTKPACLPRQGLSGTGWRHNIFPSMPTDPSGPPACPACRPASHAKMVESGYPLRSLPVAAFEVTVLHDVRARSSLRLIPALWWPSSPPLYLAIRTLLI
jgi:hypothetical protein